MSWLTKNVGSLGNLASRIAAEANGDNQHGNNETLQQLQQQLEEKQEELFERHQEWERAKQNYETRLKSLTDGNATAQKVEQLEQQLSRAAELLRTLNNDKKQLNARIITLEEEKKTIEATAAAAESEAAQRQASNNGVSDSEHDSNIGRDERIKNLEAELEAEREKHLLFAQTLKEQISTLTESNESLKAQLSSRQEETDAQVELSIQLEMTREELEQAKDEISALKENNVKLANQLKTVPQSPSQQSPSPALVKELADAKSIISKLETRLSKESDSTSELNDLKTCQEELRNALSVVREELRQSKEDHSAVQSELTHSKTDYAALEKSGASMSETIAQLNSQLDALKISEIEGKKLNEQYEDEKRNLLANHDSLLLEFEKLKSKYNEHTASSAVNQETGEADLKEQFEEEKAALLVAHDNLKQELEMLQKKYEEDSRIAEGILKDREQTIHDLETRVAASEQALKSVNEDLQRIVNERNHFQSQHKTLLDRVSNMKSTLGTKLQADMENINTLRQQIDQLTAQNDRYIQTIKQLEEELMASHEHYEKTSRELEHLRRHMDDIKEDAFSEVIEKENLIQELQSRLQREEREREDWETMASEQRASKDQAVMNMRAIERERDAARAEKEALRQELNREIESLNNLQTVLEEFQSTKESEILFALEGLQRDLKATSSSLEEYQNRALTAEEQLRHLTLDVEKARQLEKEVKEKNQLIGKLRHDAVIQQGHLTEAMRRLKEENNQNTVDIPLISNLFISFLNIPRGDQKRFEILQLISGVLKFTDEQREQAGLIRKAGGLGSMTPTTSGSRSPSMEQMRQHQEPRESFIDMWASFLIRESNANAGGNNANPRSP